jgi:PRTRC genetic system protein B
MFSITTGNLTEVKQLSDSVKGEFAISFSKLANDSYLLCKHDIDKDAVIGRGKPIPFSALESAISTIQTHNRSISDKNNGIEDKPNFWCLPTMIYQSSTTLIWYRPASRTPGKLWFRINDGICVDAKLPTLVFCYSRQNGELRVFASASKKVTKSTALYHAPLSNINGEGILCFGSAERPNVDDSANRVIKAAESAVLETMFSHVNHSQTFAGDAPITSADHVRRWQALSAANLMPKAKDMVKIGSTVEALVSKD